MIYIISLVLLPLSVLFFHKKQEFSKTFRILRRDLRLLQKFLVGIFHVIVCILRKDTVAKIFTRLAKKHPQKIAFYFEDETWTFEQLEHFSNKIANFFKSQGYKKGDVVAFFLEARPEFVGIWLGLGKIGVITSLINTNLFGDPLVHCIKAAEPKSVIFGSTLKDAVKNISQKISDLKLYEFSEKNEEIAELFGNDLRKELKLQPETSPKAEISKLVLNDKLMYIYTSGTTGLPKAVNVKNFKYVMVCVLENSGVKFDENDIMYNCLPLYHSMGGIPGIGHTIIAGHSVVIKKKFSASNFWKDCVKYKCTSAMYIGELCRYLLADRSNEKPIKHSVKKFIGSGLKPQIWNQFVSKFNIREVYEIYGSTEGNTNLINLDNTPGSVGCRPFWAKPIYPVSLIRCDDTAEPIRGETGFCQLCEVGEPGLMIGKITTGSTMVEFAGYTDKKATEKKLLKNVFKKGDVYFNSGDVLYIDDMGYYYFRDRTGDTFRWKGENVSTAEVEAVISNILNLNDAVVYGVEVPNSDGKAGMAAIVSDIKNLNLDKFCQSLRENLPSYAIPRFLRIVDAISITATFKIKKIQLQQEGFDVEKIQDIIFLYDAKNATYVELTKERYEYVMSGKIRL